MARRVVGLSVVDLSVRRRARLWFAPMNASSKAAVHRLGIWLALLALLGGCAALPRDVPRTPSQAIAASPDTELGRIARASAPDRTRSGFRLLSWWTQSLQARI